MKVLIISSASMQRAWQEKFLNISNYDEFEIIMLLPKYWVENYKRVYPYLITLAPGQNPTLMLDTRFLH